jgi:hypothetical protein
MGRDCFWEYKNYYKEDGSVDTNYNVIVTSCDAIIDLECTEPLFDYTDPKQIPDICPYCGRDMVVNL